MYFFIIVISFAKATGHGALFYKNYNYDSNKWSIRKYR